MKLPNDFKEEITKELIDELHEDLWHFCLNCNADISAKYMYCTFTCHQEDLLRDAAVKSKYPQQYNCHNCSAVMEEQAWTCSAECLKEDLRKR